MSWSLVLGWLIGFSLEITHGQAHQQSLYHVKMILSGFEFWVSEDMITPWV